MKKMLQMAIGLLLLLSQNFVPIQAANWNTDIYHFNDFTDTIDSNQSLEENNQVDAAIETCQFDISTFVIDASYLGSHSFDYYLDTVYTSNQMGYGMNQDGIALGINISDEQFSIRTFGRGNEIFTKDKLIQLATSIQEGYQNGYMGAQIAYRQTVSDIVLASSLKVDSTKRHYMSTFSLKPTPFTGTISQEGVLPNWYVSDPSSFKDFHNDPDQSRCIDNADIFSDEEETIIQEKCKKIFDTEKQDIVIYTDTSSYGIDNELFSQDFFVYNGYGYGDSYDGLILFVNMDPNNREMVTSACGNAKKTFTRYNSEALDDLLYDQFVNKNYAQGVYDWFDGIENVLHYGSIHIPEWYKNYVDGKPNTNPKDNKVIDDLRYFDETTKVELNQQLLQLKEKYGYDVIVYLTDTAQNISGEDSSNEERVKNYIDTFYHAHNFDPDAIVLTLFRDENANNKVNVTTYGTADEKISQKVKDRLEGITLTNLGSQQYETNIDRYLKYLEKYLKNGWLPHTPFVRICWLILCTIVGSITGAIFLGIAKRKMKVVKKATTAREELVDSSFKVLHAKDILVNRTTESIFSPRRDDSSSRGGGSSHRSSYSSHSSSSSGRSFSSSRRKF